MNKAKNIILFLADGMGTAQAEAGSLYFNGTSGAFPFQSFSIQKSLTNGSHHDAVTDSAAAATSIATGHIVDNGVISVQLPGDGRKLKTLFEFCRDLKKRTGFVTTSFMTDATPAAFAAHNTSRYNYSAIATDYFSDTRPNLLFGGGSFDASKPLMSGYSVVTTKAEMEALTKAQYACGMFGTWSFPFEYDGYETWRPNLSEMTTKALELLDNDDGFMLVVENENIDESAHSNDLQRNVFEVKALSDAVGVALSWAAGSNDTLVMLVSDHDTGGLVISGGGLGQLPVATWATTGHTGKEVVLYAEGAGTDVFADVAHLSDIFRAIGGLLMVGPADASFLVPSVTVKVVNSGGLRSATREKFGGELPAAAKGLDASRFRGAYDVGDAVWGFAEGRVSTTSKRVANAVVLAGEKVGLYISQVGHGSGYYPLDNADGVYSRTTVSVSFCDLLRGFKRTVSLSNLEDPGSAARNILWNVPAIDSDSDILLSTHGVDGLYLVVLRVCEQLFSTPDLLSPVLVAGRPVEITDEFQIQVSAVSWNRILSEFSGKCPVRNISVGQNAFFLYNDVDLADDATKVMDEKTTFPDYYRTVGGVTVPLSGEEKEVILRDNCMVVLSSQAPVLTADSAAAPVIGLGIAPASSDGSRDSVPTASLKPFIQEAGVSRRFGLTGVAGSFNLLDALCDMTGDHSQLSTTLRDPPAIILGVSSSASLGFVAAGSSVAASRLTEPSPVVATPILLGGRAVRVENIVIQVGDTTQFENESADEISSSASIAGNFVKVSFDVVEGESLVKSLSIGIAVNSEAYAVAQTKDKHDRWAVFSTESLGASLTYSDVIRVRVGVEDVDGQMCFFYGCKYLAFAKGNPVVDGARIQQRRDGSGVVDVFYNYHGAQEVSPGRVALTVKSEFGEGDVISGAVVRGDVGEDIHTGLSRRAVWRLSDSTTPVPTFGLKADISLVNLYGDSPSTRAAQGVATGALTSENPLPPWTPLVRITSVNRETARAGSPSGENIKSVATMATVLGVRSIWTCSSSASRSSSGSSFSSAPKSTSSSVSTESTSSETGSGFTMLGKIVIDW